MRRRMSLGTTVVATIAIALVAAVPARAAAPNYILISGPGLTRPVLLANWQQNEELLLAVANAPRAHRRAARLGGRARFDLAEFWAWSGRPRPTSPAQASQHGSFYPARGSRPAVIVLTVQGVTAPRLAPRVVLRAFAEHRVPTRR